MPESLPDFAAMAGEMSGERVTSGEFAALDDDALVDALATITMLRHAVERCQAIAAAELSRRSRVAFGQRALARRSGHANTGDMLQSITRSSRRETAALVEVGQMIAETDTTNDLQARRADAVADLAPDLPPPWFAELGAAVNSGVLSVAVAGAIRSALGEPGGEVDEATLRAELALLIPTCRSSNVDTARRAARQVRDRIDAAGVVARAAHQRDNRFWRVWVKPDGMVRGEFELEPESGMLVKAIFDQLTHPRHLEPSARRAFGDPVRGDTAFADARGARQRDAADGLIQLLRAGATIDPERILHEKKPSVRLVVNANVVSTGFGSGMIEGHPDRIPLADIHTGLCVGHLPIRFDGSGAPLDLGRDERLFTDRQKTALAIRDGGCMDPDCTRPPSWTEAHHIDHWRRDGGRTDLADGVLLCRRDHLRYHNEGWEVRRDGHVYWLIPPAGVDPLQTPRLMKPKTPADIINPVDPARLFPAPAEPSDRELLPAAG